MFQALPALPRKLDNEFNQPLISGAISSPEEMEIAGFFRVSFVCCLLEIGLFWVGFFLCFSFVVAVWAVGAWQGFEALDQDSVTLGALGCEIFGQREEGRLTLSC